MIMVFKNLLVLLGGHLAADYLYQLVDAFTFASKLFWMRSNHLNNHLYVRRYLR